jgi:hypothetical protein
MKATYKILEDEINIKRSFDPITIYFFGDVHRDTRNCDVDRWKYFLKQAKDSMDENTYFIGLGDYNDFASTSEKKKISHAELHETTRDMLDSMVEKHNRDFASEISFMRGRVLGFIDGNHSWVFENGKTSNEDLAERMDTKDLGWLCHYTLMVRCNTHRINRAIHMILCHGKAGGKTLGITVNQVGDLKNIFPIADLYVMGHDHQRIAHPSSVLVPIRGLKGYQIKQKRQLLCRSGSFMRAYENNSSSYQIFKLYRPSDIGALKVRIQFHRHDTHNGDATVLDLMAEI